MPNSALSKQIGRISFLLSSLLVALIGSGALQLLRSHAESHRATLAVECALVLLSVFWIRSLERRLRDAGLPRWLFWPYFLFVFAVCLGARARGVVDDTQTFLLFAALQLPTVLFRSRPSPADAEYNQPVGHFLFLLRLLLLAAFSAALFHLQETAGNGLALWEMRLGLVMATFVWIYNVEGRLLDAELPRWWSIPYCLIVPTLCFLPVWFNVINLTLALVLFVAVQLPTVFFYQKAIVAEPSPPNTSPEETAGLPSKWRIQPTGGFEFAVYILLIAGLWSGLHLLRGDITGGLKGLAWDVTLDAGSLLLGGLWIISVRGRMKAAGRARSTFDLCAIVLLPCLLLFAFRVIGFPQALVLFVVLQIPVVLMRRDSILARLFLADADS